MYRRIACYYDLLHDDLVSDIEFVAGLAKESGDPILELGCGTGRLLLALARQGYRVVGVDASEEMLALAQDKIQREPEAVRERITLVEGDISGVRLEERFPLAVIAYNTLMHLGPAELASSLGNVRRHLLPGGALFIDVDNPADVHDPGQDGLLLLDRTVYDAIRDEVIVLSVSSVGDGQRQTRETVWIIDVSATEGGPLVRTIARSTLHYYFAHQLDQILETAGYRLVEQYGNYNRHAYDTDTSPRLILIASAR